MNPVLAGMIQYTDLLRSELRLADIARMNDALLVRATNERRMNEKVNSGT